MKALSLFLILTMSPLFAAQDLDRLDCISNDGLFSLTAIKAPCVDERYQQWQRNGCYQVTVTGDGMDEEFEMVRNISYQLEERQKAYSLFTYDKREWILDGLMVELEATDGRRRPRMRFDTRDSARRPFVSRYGVCTLTK